MRRLLAFALAAGPLALAACGGSAPTEPTPSPAASPAPSPTTTLAFVQIAHDSVRLYALDPASGGLLPRGESVLTGTAPAPVVSGRSFEVDPTGRFLYFSYDSCRTGWCGNVASYAIGADASLRLAHQLGPEPLEGGMDILAAREGRVIAHCNDAPIHWFSTYGVDAEGRLALDGSLSFGYGHLNVPHPYRTAPGGRVAYGLTWRGLMTYLLDESGTGRSTTAYALPSRGAGLEIDASGKRLYISLATAPPRIDVYAVDDEGLRGLAASYPATAAGALQLDPTGRFLYSSTADTVDTYAVGGVLSPAATAALEAPDGLSFEPSGRFAYAAANGEVSGYSVDPSSGALRALDVRVPGVRIRFATRAVD